MVLAVFASVWWHHPKSTWTKGVYYVALWTDVEDVAPAALHKIVHKDMTINKETGEPRIWQILRIRAHRGGPGGGTDQADADSRCLCERPAQMEHRGPPHPPPSSPINRILEFIRTLGDAEVEPCGEGEKVRLQIQSDSWFVAFCIASCPPYSGSGTGDLAHDDYRTRQA